MDCCCVVTDSNVEILQRIPPDTAALLNASDSFENGSPASDEAIRAIMKTGMLLKATVVCIDAAAREFDINMRKRLLRQLVMTCILNELNITYIDISFAS